MSSQLTLVHNLPLEAAGETGSSMFGQGSKSPIAIPKILLAKLWGLVDQGVRLLPRGGAEIGGLLVGPKSRENGLVVDAILPLTIEYKYGPSMKMSDSDFAKLAELIESVQSDPAKAVVGFYRSQTRKNETFRETDRQICAAIEKTHSSFADDFLCYFVVAPVSRAEKLAHVWMKKGTDWDYSQSLLRANTLPSVPAPPPTALRDKVHVETPSVETPSEQVPPAPGPVFFDFPVPASAPTGRPGKKFYSTLAIFAAIFVISAAGMGGYNAYEAMLKTRAAAAEAAATAVQANVPPLRMGFSAAHDNGLWKLSWDRGTMDVLKPSGAVLDIKDGANQQQIHLTPADLSSGTIYYTSRSGDLSFSLQLDGPGTTPGAAQLEEHVRILEGPPPAPETAATNPTTPAKPSARVPNAIVPQGPPSLEEPPNLVQ
jgi:hypothetical protein